MPVSQQVLVNLIDFGSFNVSLSLFLVLFSLFIQEQLFASIARGDLNKLIALLRKHPNCVSVTEEVKEREMESEWVMVGKLTVRIK